MLLNHTCCQGVPDNDCNRKLRFRQPTWLCMLGSAACTPLSAVASAARPSAGGSGGAPAASSCCASAASPAMPAPAQGPHWMLTVGTPCAAAWHRDDSRPGLSHCFPTVPSQHALPLHCHARPCRGTSPGASSTAAVNFPVVAVELVPPVLHSSIRCLVGCTAASQ